MEKFNTWLKETWEKVKAFMLKKWLGFPVWGWASGLVLILVLVFFLFQGSTSKLKKSKVR